MDAATVDMILSIHRQDAQDFLTSRKGKQKEGKTNDLEFAVELQKAEYEHVTTVISDHRMCQSIGRAIQDDGAALSLVRGEETAAARDRQIALSLSRGEIPPRTEEPLAPKPTPLTEALLTRFSALNIIFQDTDTSSIVASAEQNFGEGCSKPYKRAQTPELFECSSCLEVKPAHQTYTTECEHVYCHDCLIHLFELSLADESLFPPRCCKRHIPRSAVHGLVAPSLIHKSEKKDVERCTTDRTYCCNAECSTFILPEDVDGKSATCLECGQVTCVECKKGGHGEQCVLVDEVRDQALRLASENGWRTCPRCHNMVELSQGCNHITCLCRAEFCYVCGAMPWKTCGCEQWTEDRLFDRAEQIVNRYPQRNEGAADRAHRIDVVAQAQRQRHDCEHGRFRTVPGQYECEECHHHMPSYIYECGHCQFRVCQRCRRNRL